MQLHSYSEPLALTSATSSVLTAKEHIMVLEQELLELHQEVSVHKVEPIPSHHTAPILLSMSPLVSLPVPSIVPSPPPDPLTVDICKRTSVRFLTSPLRPYSPLVYMYFPHTSVPSPGTTLKGQQLSYSKSDDFPEVNSLNVVDFLRPPPLIPQQHRTSLGHIGTDPCDTTAPSAIMWIPIYGRLGTRRLGTVILCISFVD
jgi:hypothetical protein